MGNFIFGISPFWSTSMVAESLGLNKTTTPANEELRDVRELLCLRRAAWLTQANQEEAGNEASQVGILLSTRHLCSISLIFDASFVLTTCRIIY